jgi:hypothetical protein
MSAAATVEGLMALIDRHASCCRFQGKYGDKPTSGAYQIASSQARTEAAAIYAYAKRLVQVPPAEWRKEAEALAHEMQRRYHSAMVWSSKEDAEYPPAAKAAWQEYQAARAKLLAHLALRPADKPDTSAGVQPVEAPSTNDDCETLLKASQYLREHKLTQIDAVRGRLAWRTAGDAEPVAHMAVFGDIAGFPGVVLLDAAKRLLPGEYELIARHRGVAACSDCKGTGADNGTNDVPCGVCNGTAKTPAGVEANVAATLKRAGETPEDAQRMARDAVAGVQEDRKC